MGLTSNTIATRSPTNSEYYCTPYLYFFSSLLVRPCSTIDLEKCISTSLSTIKDQIHNARESNGIANASDTGFGLGPLTFAQTRINSPSKSFVITYLELIFSHYLSHKIPPINAKAASLGDDVEAFPSISAVIFGLI